MTLPNDIYINGAHYEENINRSYELRQVRKWGDEIMMKYGFDVNQVHTSNFQAVRTWNDGNRTFGGVTNFLRIPLDQMKKLRSMQLGEQTDAGYFTPDQKMEWLCSPRGSMYMYENDQEDWENYATTRWGTICIGGNIVQVERYEIIDLSIMGQPRQRHSMARLVGFGPQDWNRPLGTLVALGLVHRCFCAYFPNNGFGDSPKGVVFSPFFDPKYYDFVGPLSDQPSALYIPEMWLED